METIKLQDISALTGREKLPRVPRFVKPYLDLAKYNPEGKYFRIVINHKSNTNTGAGIAYSNELVVEKKIGDKWEEQYSTGMRQYRGAYAHEIDDWDLSLNDPAILKESKDEVTYALRTGGGNIKVYRFKEKYPETLEVFSARDYDNAKRRLDLLKKIADDPKAFEKYVDRQLGDRWHAGDKEVLDDGKVIVLLVKHYDRDYDAIVNSYQIHVWLKGKGLGASGTFRTGLRHPGGKFYSVDLGLSSAVITSRGRNFLIVNTEVRNRSQSWAEKRDFRIEWQESESADEFESHMEKEMERIVKTHTRANPLYQPTRITEQTIDPKCRIAAFILFEQIDSDRNLELDTEGWLGDQFRYSVWRIYGLSDPEQVFEDHDYIRPRTVSQLTGTRGRDCALRNLKFDGEKISIENAEGKILAF